MAARLPLLKKTPFVLDPGPLAEATSAHAGVLATSRAFRSLGIPDLIEASLRLRKRQRGYSEGQMVESLVLLQTVGGECPEDIRLLANDACLQRGLGYAPPKVTAAREFLDLFHDEAIALQRPSREEQKSFILPSTEPVAALQTVQAHTVRRIAQRYAHQGQAQRIATVDQDATIIESHKRAARPHYEGGRGYQPMVAVWAEADLVLADEFRDGNVPARQAPVTCAKMAFEALPPDIQQRYFRGDSACHEAVNAAWFKLALLSYNLASAIKGLCFDPDERTVRFKKYRLLLVHLAGRMNRNNCVMGLRLCAPRESIRRMQKVWAVFALPTHATATKALGRASP